MDPTAIKANNAMFAIVEFYGQALAQSAEREELLRRELETQRQEIEVLKKMLATGVHS